MKLSDLRGNYAGVAEKLIGLVLAGTLKLEGVEESAKAMVEANGEAIRLLEEQRQNVPDAIKGMMLPMIDSQLAQLKAMNDAGPKAAVEAWVLANVFEPVLGSSNTPAEGGSPKGRSGYWKNAKQKMAYTRQYADKVNGYLLTKGIANSGIILMWSGMLTADEVRSWDVTPTENLVLAFAYRKDSNEFGLDNIKLVDTFEASSPTGACAAWLVKAGVLNDAGEHKGGVHGTSWDDLAPVPDNFLTVVKSKAAEPVAEPAA